MRATVTSKGQVTLPKPIRDALGFDPGTILDFEVDERGKLLVRKVNDDPLALFGIAKRRGQKAATLEEMDDAIAEGIVERNRRAR